MAVTFVDNVTPLNAVNMNLLEQFSNKNVANGYPALDASSNLALAAAQKIIWATDTNLYRSSANVLKTDGRITACEPNVTFHANPGTVGGYAFFAQVGAEANGRFAIAPSGQMYWGPGGATAMGDTNLYRFAAGQLKTDGLLVGQGGVISQIGTAYQIWLSPTDGKLYFGSASDTNLYRAGVNSLKTDGVFYAGAAVVVDASGGGYKLLFGSAQDTNLYRFAAGALATDGSFRSLLGSATNSFGFRAILPDIAVAHWPFQVFVGAEANPRFAMGGIGGLNWGPGGGSGFDVNLYRVSAGVLQTDASFHAVGGVSLRNGEDQVTLHGELVREGSAVKALKLLINGVPYRISLRPA